MPPITTLQQYVTSVESGEEIESVAEFEDSSVLRAVSDSISGKSHNTINTESLDIKGSSSSLVKGLRVGKKAISRINFGGLVASGVPGFAPDVGTWGFGKIGETKFNNRYGAFNAQGTAHTGSDYSNHVPTSNIISDNIGNGQLYGFRFKDNLGVENGIRYIYRKIGESFANSNTTLPSTIEDEVCVFFDDRDVGQGGFTIGKHMHGVGDATGRLDTDASGVTKTLQYWKGARWRGVSAPNAVMHVSAVEDTSAGTLAITFDNSPYQGGGTPYSTAFSGKGDLLGYLGFPKKNGIIQITDYDAAADVGITVSYASRDHDTFYGCTGLVTLPDDVLIASVLNWTTLVTDELIAAVTAAAINAGNEINTEEGHVFDCREMYTTDGRTFGEWGVKDDAIRIRAYNTQSPIIPLNQSYSSVVKRDYGIHASHLEFGEVRRVDRVTNGEWDFDTSTSTGHGTRPVTNTNIDASQGIDCGYIPYTLLEITTVSRGPNSNTASPNLVDSTNTPIDTSTWNEGLKGIQFTRSSGDHILPMIDNPVVHFGSSQSNWTTEVTVSAAREVDPFLIPSGATASNVILPVGERATIWLGDYPIEAESKTGTDPRQELSWLTADAGDDFPQSMAKANILQRHNNKEFDGLRSLGSVFSEANSLLPWW